MTVRDLIMLLSELPPEATVLVEADAVTVPATLVEPVEYPSGSTVLIA